VREYQDLLLAVVVEVLKSAHQRLAQGVLAAVVQVVLHHQVLQESMAQ
jgi:hypothetical protein